MGCFGYICKGCKTPINGDCFNGGEKCVLIHVRNGVEMGRVEGHYNEYGSVMEQGHLSEAEKFRGDYDGINGHFEICKSEFRLDDSYFRLKSLRLYLGEEIDYTRYVIKKVVELSKTLEINEFAKLCKGRFRDIRNKARTNTALAYQTARGILAEKYLDNDTLLKDFQALPSAVREVYSGTATWHSKCYKKASDAEKANLTPSENDPCQSWGKVRKKYS